MRRLTEALSPSELQMQNSPTLNSIIVPPFTRNASANNTLRVNYWKIKVSAWTGAKGCDEYEAPSVGGQS